MTVRGYLEACRAAEEDSAVEQGADVKKGQKEGGKRRRERKWCRGGGKDRRERERVREGEGGRKREGGLCGEG